jgi:hypothetical protein
VIEFEMLPTEAEMLCEDADEAELAEIGSACACGARAPPKMSAATAATTGRRLAVVGFVKRVSFVLGGRRRPAARRARA